MVIQMKNQINYIPFTVLGREDILKLPRADFCFR